MASSPLVSIVILNWNGLENTKICLKHVFKLDYPNYEVILVDNGSNSAEKDYLSRHRNIIYVDNLKNRGFAGGQVDGYSYAQGKYILLLNNDAVIAPDYLKQAMKLFTDKTVAVVGGRSYFWNKDEPLFNESNRYYSYMNINIRTGETDLQTTDNGIVQEVNTVSGSAVIVRRSVIEEVGYLYEPFFAYYEETDLFARVKRAGYKVLYNPKQKIWHKNGASSGSQDGSFFFYYHIFRNRYMYVLRNFERKYVWAFLKNYYLLGFKLIAQIPRSKAHRTIGVAYAKAITRNLIYLPLIMYERLQLQSFVGTRINYCELVIKEQTNISIIIDGTNFNQRDLDTLTHALRQRYSTQYEYVVVVGENVCSTSTMERNVRVITDRHYFSVHPIVLGCLAARFDWMLITGPRGAMTIDSHHAEISRLSGSNYEVYSSPQEGKLAVIGIKKKYFQQIPRLGDRKSLDDVFDHISKYAFANEALYVTNGKNPILSKEEIAIYTKRINKREVVNNSFLHNMWTKLLTRHHKLHRLVDAAKWFFSPSVPIRLKIGRTKNLLLFSMQMNRKKLAVELRHIRNELVIYNKHSHPQASNTTLPVKKVQAIMNDTLSNISEIPVFIICYERVETLATLVGWLEQFGIHKIIFIDNDSSYPPLLHYYDNSPYQVIRLYRNIGHTAPWSLGIIPVLVPDGMYIVTDPDIIPTNECPLNAIRHFVQIHIDHPSYRKVGFGLRIDDIPKHYPLKNAVADWEKQFWATEIAENIYDAPTDTTFALYKPYVYDYFLAPSIRTGWPYVARHTPWYVNPTKITDEEQYYRQRASSNITSWNVDELPERYRKEMKNASGN